MAPQAVGRSQQHHSQATADHLGAVSPSASPPTLVPLKTAPSFTLGRPLFSLPVAVSPYNFVTKAETTDMAARQCRQAFQKNTQWPNERHLHRFLKSLKCLLSRTAESTAEDNAVWSLFCCLFVENIMPKLMMLKLKARMSDLEGQAVTWWLLCSITLLHWVYVFTVCVSLLCGALPHFALPTEYKQCWNKRRIRFSPYSLKYFLLYF